MKKIIISLVLTGLCFSAFANIFIQQDVKGVGSFFDIDHDCFDLETPDSFSTNFTALAGSCITAAWEFNSKDTEAPVHFFAGFDVGIVYVGGSLAPVAGLTWDLAKIGNCNLSLMASVEVGGAFALLGGIFLLEQNNLDLIITPKDRRGFFGGIGLTNINMPDLRIYHDYGYTLTNMGYFGGRILAGYRF